MAARRLAVLALVVLASCGGTRQATSGGGQRVAASVQRFISSPANESDYLAIWGELPSAGLQQRDRSALAGLASDITKVAPSGASDAASVFRASVENSTADVVTVIGHNDGGQLKFPDGTAVSLSELGGVGPLVAMISCDAARFNNGNAVGILPSSVTLQSAVQIEQALHARLKELPSPPDLTTLQRLLDESTYSVLDARPELWNYSVASVGGGAVAVGIWQIHEG